jgi:hypothetical protein
LGLCGHARYSVAFAGTYRHGSGYWARKAPYGQYIALPRGKPAWHQALQGGR